MQRTPCERFWHLLLAATLASACSDAGAPAASAPGAPSNLVAGPLGGGVHLTWSDNSQDEELFEIERKEGEAGNAFQKVDSVPFGTALYHDSNVSLGKVYTYRVRAKLPLNFSSYSNQALVNLVPGGGGSAGAGGQGNGAGSSAVAGSGSVAGSSAGGSGTVGGSSAGDSFGGSGTAGQPSTNPVSFKTDIVPTLVQACGSTTTGCHSRDQAVGRIMPQFGPCKVIWFSPVDEPVGATYTSGPSAGEPTGCPDLELYQRLMTLHSMLCHAPSWDQRARYVVPGDLEKSLLYQVIDGDATMGGVCKAEGAPVRRMPLFDAMILPNGVELSPDQIVKIRDWILQGAPNN